MAQQYNKPISVAILEAKQGLVQVLQNAGLPPVVAAPILTELAQAWQQAAQEQTQKEYGQWQQAVREAEQAKAEPEEKKPALHPLPDPEQSGED